MVKRHLATIPAAGALLCLALGFLTLGLAGCAGDAPRTAAPTADAAYVPDPNDPLGRWVPLIREASQRYDMPEKWIRAVMMRESNGRSVGNNGKALTSPAGAIGLMQVMPGTYELMRWQYGLGPNPADPHDNIMAGTAYLREMYDLFGAPGFLAAYNCGPACYAGHLAGKQKLPRETRQYVAALTPILRGAAPHQPSQSAGASAIEVAVVPDDAPKAPKASDQVVVAMVSPEQKPDERKPEAKPEPVAVAALAVEPRRMEPKPAEVPAPVTVAAAPAATPVPVVVPPSAPAPVAVASADPAPSFVPAPGRTATAGTTAGTLAPRSGKPPVRSVETQVAEALLSPQATASGQRVVIRFVSQQANGCGSLKGKDSVCITLASREGL